MIPLLPIAPFTRIKSSRDRIARRSSGESSSSNSGLTQRSMIRDS
jgi:hypothetical protein